MKTKLIILLICLVLISTLFFFKIVPVPVENSLGINNKEDFVYGGIYWTSQLEQTLLGNYKSLELFSLMSISLIGGVCLLRI